jgi:hypothetical protein
MRGQEEAHDRNRHKVERVVKYRFFKYSFIRLLLLPIKGYSDVVDSAERHLIE